MKKYYMDHPDNDKYEIQIPNGLAKQIVIDYLTKTYYWTIAILSGMVGFMLGIIVK